MTPGWPLARQPGGMWPGEPQRPDLIQERRAKIIELRARGLTWTPSPPTSAVATVAGDSRFGQIAQHCLCVGADSPPGTGTGRRALTQMEQRRRRYAAVPCRRHASTLPGSGRLAG